MCAKMPALYLRAGAFTVAAVCMLFNQQSVEMPREPFLADSVLIEGLVVETVVGVYDWEREVTQSLVVDLEMAWDNRIPGASDDVKDALDYASVSERVDRCLKELKPKLLEHGAEVLAGVLQREFGVGWLRLVLRKPGAVPAARSVGVCIERTALKGEPDNA